MAIRLPPPRAARLEGQDPRPGPRVLRRRNVGRRSRRGLVGHAQDLQGLEGPLVTAADGQEGRHDPARPGGVRRRAAQLDDPPELGLGLVDAVAAEMEARDGSQDRDVIGAGRQRLAVELARPIGLPDDFVGLGQGQEGLVPRQRLLRLAKLRLGIRLPVRADQVGDQGQPRLGGVARQGDGTPKERLGRLAGRPAELAQPDQILVIVGPARDDLVGLLQRLGVVPMAEGGLRGEPLQLARERDAILPELLQHQVDLGEPLPLAE